jgi:hypothetical protein
VGKFNDKKEACTFIKAQANFDFNPLQLIVLLYLHRAGNWL